MAVGTPWTKVVETIKEVAVLQEQVGKLTMALGRLTLRLETLEKVEKLRTRPDER